MKDKNKKLIILIMVSLVSIGISFAYYTSKLLGGGVGGNINVSTAVINGSTLKVEGTLSFDDKNILPGHKNISSIKVTATGSNEIIPYNLIWNGINNLGTSLNFTVYKTNNKVTTSINCIEEKGIQEGKQTLNEKCTIENIESLGEILATGIISQNETAAKTILAKDEVITSSEAGTSVYYYVILEYPNLEENQNEDKGKGFEGIVTVEKSEISADINILAVNISDDGENYIFTQDIPQTGYKLNAEKSTCTNGAIPKWDTENNGLLTINLTKSGTSCMLYFDKGESTVETIIGSTTVLAGTNSFTGIATEVDTGLYSIYDDDGTTYYYRGVLSDDTVNNWLNFAGFKWRIIRINSDGSIRIIYNGTSTTATGTGTQISTSAFNNTTNHNKYVGYMYGASANDYASTHANTNSSTIKGVLDNWYKTNIYDKNYDKYVSKEAGFCGDRQVVTGQISGYTGNGGGTSTTSYAPFARLYSGSAWKTTQTPTYSCNTNDLYTVAASSKGNHALQYPIGLITSDEVVYAGGFGGTQNKQYWLYTGQYFWTMSPSNYYGGRPDVIYFYENGSLDAGSNLGKNMNTVNSSFGVRPVINIASDVQLSGNGTTTDPFKIDGA